MVMGYIGETIKAYPYNKGFVIVAPAACRHKARTGEALQNILLLLRFFFNLGSRVF
jgi:hypothetical protein